MTAAEVSEQSCFLVSPSRQKTAQTVVNALAPTLARIENQVSTTANASAHAIAVATASAEAVSSAALAATTAVEKIMTREERELGRVRRGHQSPDSEQRTLINQEVARDNLSILSFAQQPAIAASSMGNVM